MTIVNMVGGGGEEDLTITPETITLMGVSSFESSTSSNSKSTFAYNVSDLKSYTLMENSKLSYTVRTKTSPNHYTSFKTLAGVGIDNFNKYDTITNYLKSRCPVGKTFTATLTGMGTVGVSEDVSYVSPGPEAIVTASGDSNNVTYRFPGFVGYAHGFSTAYSIFIPTTIFMKISE